MARHDDTKPNRRTAVAAITGVLAITLGGAIRKSDSGVQKNRTPQGETGDSQTPSHALRAKIRRSTAGEVSLTDYGGAADWDGHQGTDNRAALQAAIDDTPEGGRLVVAPGRYHSTGKLLINKTIDLDCATGSFTSGPIGTELNFSPGVSGIQIEQGRAENAPSKWRIGPFMITSGSTKNGEDNGIRVNAGRGAIDGTTIEGFGSHGIHIVAGIGYGGGNANNTYIERIRSYNNRGDGLRIEGTDANACIITKADIVANHGWGINIERAAMTKIIAAHADQTYNDSPGAYRDNGNSNDWDWVYSESGAPFLIDTHSSNGRLATSNYASPAITTAGQGWQTWRVMQEASINSMVSIRSIGGTKAWNLRTGGNGEDSLDLTNQTDNKRVLTIDSSVTRAQWYTGHQPAITNSFDLGSGRQAWRRGYFSDFVRTGTFATAQRPTEAPLGATIFDHTLGIPIWASKTGWVDANGQPV